jgi:hypothetical protein
VYDSLATPQPPERHRHLLSRAAAFCAHAVETVVDRVGDWVAPKPLSDRLKDGEVSVDDLQQKPMQEDD